MFWHIEVKEKRGIFDAVGEGVKKDIFDLGIKSVRKVSFIQVYSIEGDLAQAEIRRICEELLTDKITQEYFINRPTGRPQGRGLASDGQSHKPANRSTEFVIEVAYNPGVMDPVEGSVKKAILDLGINRISSLHTAKKYVIYGRLSNAQIKTIRGKLLVNKVIQHAVTGASKGAEGSDSGYKFQLVSVDLLSASDKKLQKISRDGQLFLNLTEMRAIKKYFSRLKRNPTDVELETLAQTWSEHCVHKTFRGKIDYKRVTSHPRQNEVGLESSVTRRKINNLLKSTIMKATKELNKPWCVSVFSDNSGVIEFDENFDVCFKVETHNHPSALEPFGGANTGIGGVIRDPLGTGLGAKPIFNTDIFCFGPPDYPVSKLPKGSLHPKRIAKGVVSGVRDYGNKMGIPTINGAVLFSEGYIANPLVYCGTAGLIPKDKVFKKVNSGDLIVVIGGRTGRDGIHGATFSSGELTHESESVSGTAVQIGNPITEKKMLDTLLKARDKNLYNAITDCGAGGLSSAVGEMGKDLGAVVYLDKVPLKYSGLAYDEIWISEAQERMVLAVDKKNIGELLDIFASENTEATVIGEFGQDKMLKLFYQDNLAGELEMGFLHEGVPLSVKKAISAKRNLKEPYLAEKKDLTVTLKKVLSDYNVASKEWVVRQYDHEVQGSSVLKPLVGINNDGPSDAGVVRPVYSSKKGLAVSCGINPRYGEISAYWMAASAIDEALRNIVSAGGNLERTAILDNFCWGNPDKPNRLGTLVDAAFACYDFAKYFGVPFISGKDSLYNEYNVKGKSIAIPGTLLISAISVMEDVTKAVSMDIKKPGNLIYIAGETKNELGGSVYYKLYDYLGANVPQVDRKKSKGIMQALSRVIAEGLVRSAHDCSEGGLAVSLAEMCFAGGFGAEVFLSEVPYQAASFKLQASSFKACSLQPAAVRNDIILFSESNTRFVVEIEKKNQKVFEKAMQDVPLGLIGCVSGGKVLDIYGLDRKICVRADINELKEVWQAPLRW
ncbi:MAG: phosphoribosylformylglycinamidine synthase subunit PurL [Candidatus Omnitrophota bacterium]|nr:phosphoribosylformylglycinamidine synthase subunit PurL [Candidatus Omnitrophota bacterium]